MKICVLDYETFWDVGHSLTKMNPIAYVMHPDTDIISCSFKFIHGKHEKDAFTIFGEDKVKAFMSRIDWSEYLVVGHNLSGFDAMLASWRCNVKPKMWGCTLAMSTPIHGNDAGGSLAKLVEHYKLGVKDQTVLHQTKGKRLVDFKPSEIEDMRKYNDADSEQCWGLFKKLYPQTSKDEMRLIDMTVRMLVEPQFECDADLLIDTLNQVREEKLQMLRKIADQMGCTLIQEAEKTLASAPKFKKYLESLGVDVPMKWNTKQTRKIPALAKTDQEFLDMLEHENPMVALAAQSRLGVKSTLLETRIEKFLQAQNVCRGYLPITLKYYGAKNTGRWSGWAYNPQNLPRVNQKHPKLTDALRKSLRAPQGYKVVVADLSGIELRVNHFLWQVPESMEAFQKDPEHADLYKDFAADLYDITFESVDKQQRQVGKVAQLGLGFGSGWSTFQQVAKIMGGVDLSEAEAQRITNEWRKKYHHITRGWDRCHKHLPVMASDSASRSPIDPWGLCWATAGGIETPTGMIRYPNLRFLKDNDDNQRGFWYGQAKGSSYGQRIYAGKIDENIVQHLARNIIADNALEMLRVTGFQPANMVHDELIYVVPDSEAQGVLDELNRIMRTPTSWWPELVKWSEGDIAQTYGDAK